MSDYLTLQEIAKRLKISYRLALKLFGSEPGVVSLTTSRRSIRVPVSVYDPIVCGPLRYQSNN